MAYPCVIILLRGAIWCTILPVCQTQCLAVNTTQGCLVSLAIIYRLFMYYHIVDMPYLINYFLDSNLWIVLLSVTWKTAAVTLSITSTLYGKFGALDSHQLFHTYMMILLFVYFLRNPLYESCQHCRYRYTQLLCTFMGLHWCCQDAMQPGAEWWNLLQIRTKQAD